MAHRHPILRSCLMILLIVLSGPAAAPAADIVRILVPKSTSSLPLLQLAVDDPLPGVDIQTTVFINHPQALALLLKGQVDFLYTGTSQGWNNYLDGGPLKMINTGVWGLSYLIGRDPAIAGLLDLKGKKLVLPFPGAPLDFQTRYMLRQIGLDPEMDLMISYAPFLQIVAKLLAGQVDTAALPEPLASALIREHGLLRQVDYQRAWAAACGGDPRSPQVSLFSTRAYAAGKAQLIAALLAAWDNASRAMSAAGDEEARAFARILEVSPEVMEPAIAHTHFWLPPLVENRKRVLEYFARVNAALPEGQQRKLEDDFFFTCLPRIECAE